MTVFHSVFPDVPSRADMVSIHPHRLKPALLVYRWTYNGRGGFDQSPPIEACSIEQARTFRPVDAVPVAAPAEFAVETWRAPAAPIARAEVTQ